MDMKQNLKAGMLIRHRVYRHLSVLLLVKIENRRNHSSQHPHTADAWVQYMYAGDDGVNIYDSYICTCCYEVLSE